MTKRGTAAGAWKSTAHRRFILTWIYVQDLCKERPRDRQPPQSGPLAPQASSRQVRGPCTSGQAPQGMRLARPFSQAVRALAERLWVVVEGPAVEHAVILFLLLEANMLSLQRHTEGKLWLWGRSCCYRA